MFIFLKSWNEIFKAEKAPHFSKQRKDRLISFLEILVFYWKTVKNWQFMNYGYELLKNQVFNYKFYNLFFCKIYLLDISFGI